MIKRTENIARKMKKLILNPETMLARHLQVQRNSRSAHQRMHVGQTGNSSGM